MPFVVWKDFNSEVPVELQKKKKKTGYTLNTAQQPLSK